MNRTIIASTLVLTAGASAQLLPPVWDLKDGRTLDVRFAANGKHLSPDMVAVHKHVGNPEPDPTGGVFTFGDAAMRAIAAWNDANGPAGWNLNLIGGGAAPANPVITVKLAEFNLGVPVPHKGGAADAIALFIPGAKNGAGKLLDAEIWFNVKPGIDWGIGKNQMDGGDDDFKFDPIIVALHEFGHAMRLDHPAAGGTVTRENAGLTDVMKPLFDSGVHKLNPRMMFNRYPGVGDIAAAAASIPTPGTIALALAGLITAARRRR